MFATFVESRSRSLMDVLALVVVLGVTLASLWGGYATLAGSWHSPPRSRDAKNVLCCQVVAVAATAPMPTDGRSSRPLPCDIITVQ